MNVKVGNVTIVFNEKAMKRVHFTYIGDKNEVDALKAKLAEYQGMFGHDFNPKIDLAIDLAFILDQYFNIKIPNVKETFYNPVVPKGTQS